MFKAAGRITAPLRPGRAQKIAGGREADGTIPRIAQKRPEH
ncbi:unnamed protein product, partial [Caenorhabditis auriculariae]